MLKPSGDAGAGRGRRPGVVVLVGEGPDWLADLARLLSAEGFVIDRVGRLDATLLLLDEDAVHALVVATRPLSAGDVLLLRRIREAWPRTAVVVVTKTPTDPDLKQAFENGATAFLSWPASTAALRQAVGRGWPDGR